MTARYLVGDVFDHLTNLETGSVDLVVTSPPFLALRSYLPADHPDKDREIGSEATPAEFIDVMLRVTACLRRVLAPHGSICIELGDTYAGSGGAGGDYNDGSLREGQPKFNGSARRTRPVKASPDSQSHRNMGQGEVLVVGGSGWPLAKSKTLIAELYRIGLAYGRNPLRAPLSARELLTWFERIVEDMRAGGFEPSGTELLRMMTDYLGQYEAIGPYQEYERWRVRNNVTWVRPNPPVGALGDKWRPATSDLVVACTSGKRYWDDLATRRPHSPNTHRRNAAGVDQRDNTIPSGQRDGNWNTLPITDDKNPAGAPLLDWWEIPPGGYRGAHYAVFPEELVIPCVQAMCPPKVCRTCGEPSRRIVEKSPEYAAFRANTQERERRPDEWGVNVGNKDKAFDNARGMDAQFETLGWSDCGHDDYRPGLILDPFAGSGTTLAVATGYGHDAIGIDLDQRNAELALQRVGPFLLEVDA